MNTHTHATLNPMYPPHQNKTTNTGTPPAAPTWFDIPVADGAFDVTRLRWAPLPPPKRRWGGADETPGSKKKGGLSVLRLAQGDGGEEGEGVVMLVALMSAEHWCVCALDR